MADTLGELEAIYRARYAAFVRVAHAIVGQEQSARDVVHDGFVLAVRNRDRLRDERAVEPWVWRIVVNEARKRRRRESRFAEGESLHMASPAPAEPDDHVRDLISGLPERQRLALFLRYYADLDYSSIALARGIKPGTVAATLNDAHRELKTELEAEPCPLRI